MNKILLACLVAFVTPVELPTEPINLMDSAISYTHSPVSSEAEAVVEDPVSLKSSYSYSGSSYSYSPSSYSYSYSYSPSSYGSYTYSYYNGSSSSRSSTVGDIIWIVICGGLYIFFKIKGRHHEEDHHEPLLHHEEGVTVTTTTVVNEGPTPYPPMPGQMPGAPMYPPGQPPMGQPMYPPMGTPDQPPMQPPMEMPPLPPLPQHPPATCNAGHPMVWMNAMPYPPPATGCQCQQCFMPVALEQGFCHCQPCQAELCYNCSMQRIGGQ